MQVWADMLDCWMRGETAREAIGVEAAGAALHGLITAPKLTLTARAWIDKEQLRDLLDRKQIEKRIGTAAMLHKADA